MDHQREEIESIFSEFLDEKEIIDNESYSRCEIVENDSYFDISIYKDGNIIDVANDSTAFAQLLKSYSEEEALLKKIKIALDRLDYFKYEWGFKNTTHELYIKVYKNVDIDLLDAFGIKTHRHISVDHNLMHRVIKQDYNIEYNGFSEVPGTTGYYGKNSIIYLYLKISINDDSELLNDLRSLKYPMDEDKPWSRVFSRVSLTNDNKTIKLEYG